MYVWQNPFVPELVGALISDNVRDLTLSILLLDCPSAPDNTPFSCPSPLVVAFPKEDGDDI